MKRRPLLRFSVTSTPFDASSAPAGRCGRRSRRRRSTRRWRGRRAVRSGSSSVPAVAPRWPIATTASTFFAIFAASALTASSEFATWNGSSAPGFVSDGMSSFEKPTIADLRAVLELERVRRRPLLRRLAVASTMFAETNG